MEINIKVNGTELSVQQGDDIVVLKYFDEEQKKPYYAIEQYRDNPITGRPVLIFKEGEA